MWENREGNFIFTFVKIEKEDFHDQLQKHPFSNKNYTCHLFNLLAEKPVGCYYQLILHFTFQSPIFHCCHKIPLANIQNHILTQKLSMGPHVYVFSSW